jgi:hypothetical protein
MFIQHLSYHGDYACILGRVAMSDGDGMGWIPALEYLLPGTHGCMWPHPVVLGSK